jgi:SAM-dependent methyltransferase
VEALKEFASSLKIEFGWHYLLDITWILTQLQSIEGKYIMDAGAGTGLMQWYLASKGGRVLSVDRLSRANLPLRYRNRYHIEGMRPQDLNPPGQVYKTNRGTSTNSSLKNILRGGRALLDLIQYSANQFVSNPSTRMNRGTVIVYNQDLTDLSDIPDGSLDAVVSVSALEHNSPDVLVNVVREIMRVLKPGAPLIATVGASSGQDWRHEPSNGWCYSRESLKDIFDFTDEVTTNFDHYDVLLDQLKNCSELRDNLAGFYYKSGNNGMPWGKWDPQYQPAGIYKIKAVG